jgi:hypothetical protein
MSAAESVAVAVIFVWLGMVLAISFLEAPLKFRAPGVTLQIGLGIGRLVFRALNTAETALATVLVVTMIVGTPSAEFRESVTTATVVLGFQLAVVRPRLARRSDAVLGGASAPRSRSHYVYIALEGIKVLALLAAGIAVLTASHQG